MSIMTVIACGLVVVLAAFAAVPVVIIGRQMARRGKQALNTPIGRVGDALKTLTVGQTAVVFASCFAVVVIAVGGIWLVASMRETVNNQRRISYVFNCQDRAGTAVSKDLDSSAYRDAFSAAWEWCNTEYEKQSPRQ